MTFTFTGNTANKQIKALNEELNTLVIKEIHDSTYTYIEGEEPKIPEYDLHQVNDKYFKIVQNISIIKSTLRNFNAARKGQLTGLTIDQILVLLPMYNHRLTTLKNMRQTKEINRMTKSNVSEYTVINYDLTQVESEYNTLYKAITDMQEDLNYLNVTGTFDVELSDY